MGNATPAQAPQRAGLAQKGKGKGCIAKAKQGKAVAKKCSAKHWRSIVLRSCGVAMIRAAPEKLRLPRTCIGEAWLSQSLLRQEHY